MKIILKTETVAFLATVFLLKNHRKSSGLKKINLIMDYNL
jgi:hypothetical protein